MKAILSFAALAVIAFAPQPSGAQTAGAASGSNSSSSSGSSSSSSAGSASTSGTSANQQRSQQRATNNTNTNTPITFNSTTPDRLTTSSNNNNNGSYSNNNSGYTTSDNIVRTTPTVYAPPVSAGNPCSLAYSAGLSVIGWGAAAGGTVVDQDCADRQRIAMTWNAGFKSAAKELMCNDAKTYAAFKSVGEPCAVRQQFEAPGAPPTMVQQQPGPVVVTPAPAPIAPVAAKEYPRCNPARGITDNCRS